MSRLYDRLMVHGCDPLTLHDVLQLMDLPVDWHVQVSEVLTEELGTTPSEEEVNERIAAVFADARRAIVDDALEMAEYEDAVVISAEEVGDYWDGLPVGGNVLALLDVLVPPFERLFVEFQHRPNPAKMASWGVLVSRIEVEGGWGIGAVIVGEWRKGHPFGPFGRWLIPLDETGRVIRDDAAPHGTVFNLPLSIPDFQDEDVAPVRHYLAARHLGPALFALSLMHCKNVDVRPIDPPERLSKSFARKHGHPLTRYHVLDIHPMRRILDAEGEAQTKGLRHALHICRGHFKTFGDDAPLFGRHTGTYWWAAHTRGAAEEGVVEKDYRIRLDRGLGREYRDVDEHAEIASDSPEHTGLDPDLGGRGLRAHNVTQNLLARAVEEAGYEPRRAKPDEPQYDLAWHAGDVFWVAEVKSITPQNEERQLRLGLGQVIRYRQLLATEGATVRALIATEREPSDSTWADLLPQENVALVWPGNMEIAALAEHAA